MENSLCACCYIRSADCNVSYKPAGVVYLVPMCNICFEKYRITGAFLSGCLENLHQQRAYREVSQK